MGIRSWSMESRATGGFVHAAFVDGALKGFVSVESALFGGEHRYMDLSSIHVSEELRGSGVGTALFTAAKCTSSADQSSRKGASFMTQAPCSEKAREIQSILCKQFMVDFDAPLGKGEGELEVGGGVGVVGQLLRVVVPQAEIFLLDAPWAWSVCCWRFCATPTTRRLWTRPKTTSAPSCASTPPSPPAAGSPPSRSGQ